MALNAKEMGFKVRPKRNPKNLPSDYDDIPVAAMWEQVVPGCERQAKRLADLVAKARLQKVEKSS